MADTKGNSTAGMETLLKKYLSLREQADAIDAKVNEAKKALTDAMGDTEEIRLMGLKVVYRYTKTLDATRIQAEQTQFYFACLKDPELDIPKFRKTHPDLVDKYEIDTKTRPLKVIV